MYNLMLVFIAGGTHNPSHWDTVRRADHVAEKKKQTVLALYFILISQQQDIAR